MSRYFIPIPNTLKELGRMHRDLSKKHHPDLVGGNSAVMQNINSERDELKSKIEEKNSKKYGHRAESYKKVTLSVVTAKIREFVKIKFPDCKFSCSYKKHIIYVSLMEASQKVYTTSGTDCYATHKVDTQNKKILQKGARDVKEKPNFTGSEITSSHGISKRTIKPGGVRR